MRFLAAPFLALILGISACSGAGEDASPNGASESVPTSNPAESEANSPNPTTAPTSPPAATSVPAEAVARIDDGRTAAEVMADLDADPEVSALDRALAEYAVMFEPLPGTAHMPADDTFYASPGHVFDIIEHYRDDLTAEQATAFDAQVAALDAIEPIDEFALTAGPTGFRSASPAQDAPDGIRADVIAVGADIRAALGGDPLRIWVMIVPDGHLGRNVGATARNLGLGSETGERLRDRGIDVDCLVTLTEAVVADGALRRDSHARGVVTHEVFHCWQYGQLDHDTLRIVSTGVWVKEGMAAYFGEQFGGITRFNESWWGAYLGGRVEADGTWPLYSASYDAIGFWSRIANRSNLVPALKRTLQAAPDNSAMYDAAVAGMGADVSSMAAGVTQQADWGAAWTATGPGMPATPRHSHDDVVTHLDGRYVESTGSASHRNLSLNVEGVDGANGSKMTVALEGTGLLRVAEQEFIALSELLLTEWCLGDCTCPDGAPSYGADRTLPADSLVAASLVGGASTGASAVIEIEVFNPDEAGCSNPDLGDPSPGLIGTWRANPNAVAQMFEQASAFGEGAGPLEVAGVTGDVLLRFADDGTGSMTYIDVSLILNNSVVDELTINGTGTFQWGVTNQQMLIDGMEFSYGITAPILGPDPLIITHEDVPSVGITTLTGLVVDDTLTITASSGSAGEVFFPTVWDRR